MADGSGRWSHIYTGGNARVQNGYNYTTYNYGNSGSSAGGNSQQPQQRQSPDEPRKRRKEDYTVGWICALPVPELRASRVLLDEEHDDLALVTRHQYVYGSMHGHNIVMGCLPRSQTGKGAAASVASEMASTFPSLRFGLLVGVAGGAPSPAHDIRLGDVVVSEPDRDKRYGGVVQYDYGKLIQDQGFVLNGILQQPPEIVLSALGKVQSAPTTSKSSMFLKYLDLFDSDEYPEFPLQGPLMDRLFVSDCLHQKDAKNCDQCGNGYAGASGTGPRYALVKRKERKEPHTRVHYGSIASGDELMRDARKRDEIAQEHKVLCFEMEAAGLMNVFPQGGCLVVRGICDYCDTHKNKDWQPYAAAAAAAWAKEYLRNIPARDATRGSTIGDLAQSPFDQPPLRSSEAPRESWKIADATEDVASTKSERSDVAAASDKILRNASTDLPRDEHAVPGMRKLIQVLDYDTQYIAPDLELSYYVHEETAKASTTDTTEEEEENSERTVIEKPIVASLEEILSGGTKDFITKWHIFDESLQKPVIEEKIIQVPIEKGQKGGDIIKYRGIGNEYDESTGKATVQDLHFVLEVKRHPRLTREGDNLRQVIELSFREASRGYVLTATSIDGQDFIIRGDALAETTFQQWYPGYGLPNRDTGVRGDFYVNVQSNVKKYLTTDLSKKMKQLWDDL